MNFESVMQLVLVVLSICATMAAPTIWLVRKSDENIKSVEVSTAILIEKFEKSNSKLFSSAKEDNAASFKNIKDELKDFRIHFDSKISEVYVAVDTKHRELKEFVQKELDYIRTHVNDIELKIDQTRERNHEIEKDILRIQSVLGKDYITKIDLLDYIKLHEYREYRE